MLSAACGQAWAVGVSSPSCNSGCCDSVTAQGQPHVWLLGVFLPAEGVSQSCGGYYPQGLVHGTLYLAGQLRALPSCSFAAVDWPFSGLLGACLVLMSMRWSGRCEWLVCKASTGV